MTVAPEILEALDRDGYLVRPVLDADLLADLLARFRALGVPDDTEVYRSFINEPRARARQLHDELKALLAPVVAEVMPGYEAFLATYCAKGVDRGEVPYHQDWSFIDERRARGIAWWIPLVDTDDTNGSLRIIPGSHRWTAGVRVCSQVVDSPVFPHQDTFRELATTLEVPAGTAVIYDTALIHGSEPDASGQGRPAIVLQTGPAGCEIVHFHQDLDGVRGYRVDEAYFTAQEYEDEPEGYPRLEMWTRQVLADDFNEPLRLAHLAAASAASAEAPLSTRSAARPRRGMRPRSRRR